MVQQRSDRARNTSEAEGAEPSPRSAARVLVGRIARVSALSLVVLLLAGYGWLSRVHARVDRAMLQTGGRMLHTARGGEGGPRPYRINGERVISATGHSAHRLGEALRYAASTCASEGWSMPSLLRRLRDRDPLPDEGQEVGLLEGVLWAQEEGHGYVACLEGDGEASSEASQRDRQARLQAYAVSGDLNELGALRYLYFRSEGRGSRYAAVWTEGSFRPARVLGEGESASADTLGPDLPGEDLPGVRRPEGAVRRFSFAAEDGRDRLVRYQSQGASLSEVASGLRRQLRVDGFAADLRPEQSEGNRVLVARGQGRVITFVLHASEGGVSTTATESAE